MDLVPARREPGGSLGGAWVSGFAAADPRLKVTCKACLLQAQTTRRSELEVPAEAHVGAEVAKANLTLGACKDAPALHDFVVPFEGMQRPLSCQRHGYRRHSSACRRYPQVRGL